MDPILELSMLFASLLDGSTRREFATLHRQLTMSPANSNLPRMTVSFELALVDILHLSKAMDIHTRFGAG